jgi:hypothetical protein
MTNVFFEIHSGLPWEAPGDAEALGILDQETIEIDFYQKYSDYYGYVFFVMKRTD